MSRRRPFRHPEVAAKRPSKDAAPRVRAAALRGSLRSHLRVTVHSVALAALAVFSSPAFAQSVEDFYKSTPITMLVGSGAGGGYDVYARTFARFWTNHIPGHPNIIAKNMPAAAGLAAASTLYVSAERDGSMIGAFTNGAAMDPLFGNPGAHYDALKFNWLGSIGKLENVCFTWHSSAVKTVADARGRDVIVAAAGATSNSAIVPKMLNALIGTRFKVVSGYDTSSGLTMAVERGEADGICGLSWSTIKASRPHWIADHSLNVILQVGLAKLHDLPDVPSALDLIADLQNKQVMELILIRQEAGRPFAAPPGTPADRIAALRQAFADTLTDPGFIAEAAKTQLEIEPMRGEDIAAMLAKAYAAPKGVVERAAELVYPAAPKN
jgi:tripartite-type tricarboxylate transporter receptor subunit TctC